MTEASLSQLGFYFGVSGAHAGRTLMLSDLDVLLEHSPEGANTKWFSNAILKDNLLAKSSVNNRDPVSRGMRQLYALDPNICLYRVFRTLYLADTASRPMLAVLMAMARDALFRKSAEVILAATPALVINTDSFLVALDSVSAGRMGAATLRLACGNVFNSWRQAGFLTNTHLRTRVKPPVGWAAMAFALFLGWLEGDRGRLLFDTIWAKMFDRDIAELLTLATTASRQGHIEFLNAGGVIEVRFPGYLTTEELRLL